MMHEPSVFADILAKSVTKYSEIAADVLRTVFAAQCKLEKPELVDDTVSPQNNFFVSILFTGVVYGEYILATDEKTAAAILGLNYDTSTPEAHEKLRTEIADAFCEALNLVVGESIVGLNQIYRQLTITPPKVHFGSVRYPKVTLGRARLVTGHGKLECYLFIDRMKLDIAASYQEALGSMMVAHKDLQGAMDQLQNQQSALVQSEKMAALGTMAAGVAHEINTPLATVAIVGNQIKDVLSKPDAPIDRPTLLKYVDTIDKTVVRISRITNSMRFFASESKRPGFNAHKISKVMENVLIMCETQVEAAGVKLEYVPPAQDFVLECRASEISQMLLSLIENSCDAVETAPEKWIKIECREDGHSFELKISDSGPGVPETIRSRVFDPFFTTKDIGRGSGLGLSLARGVVSQHQGEISIDSSQPHTCFKILLPKKPRQVAA